jgi:hypothetical protein
MLLEPAPLSLLFPRDYGIGLVLRASLDFLHPIVEEARGEFFAGYDGDGA